MSPVNETIEFLFDYSSPYGYLASERIEAIAARHGRELVWRPILLGAVFKRTGGSPLTEAPLKGDYSLHDFARSAREHDIAFDQPSPFPIGAIAAKRATVWARDHEDEAVSALTSALVHALYRAYYVEGEDIQQPETVLALGAGVGLDAASLETALSDPSIKERLRGDVEHAIERGVFGSPTTIVDGESFWGHDRLDQVDRWLDRGGW